MKYLYKLIVIIFFFICLFLLENVDARINELPLLGRVIFIDPGHGRYYYTKTNKIDVKALNNTLNDSENIVFLFVK